MYTGTCTYDVQDITYNVQDEPVAVTIDYIENTEALGALLALMYLDQDHVCTHILLPIHITPPPPHDIHTLFSSPPNNDLPRGEKGM